MNSDLESFFSYSSGIYFDSKCDENSKLNHAVLLVGYGHDKTLGDFWIVKNTWGETWGENGYFRIKRNHCGIGMYAVFPVVD
jgi:C1A family cysteine protease